MELILPLQLLEPNSQMAPASPDMSELPLTTHHAVEAGDAPTAMITSAWAEAQESTLHNAAADSKRD